MNFIDSIKEKARNNIKKIILPETMDKRVLSAASICHKEQLAEIILIGKEEEVLNLAVQENINIQGISIIDPFKYELTEELINDFYELRKAKGMTLEKARETIKEAVSEKIQVGTKKAPNISSSTGSAKGKLRWPAIGATSISSPYGRRSFGDGWHAGIDIVRPGGSSGCTVVAAESGTVTFAGWYNSGGYTVMIDHGNGLSTMYCHMQNTLKVRSGQRVSRGQAIGNIGATGYVTGAHLHFEVKVNGKNVNPSLYL